MSAQTLAVIGLILNVIGSIFFIVDTNRLSGLLANMVKHIAEDHGKWDSTQFTKAEIHNLEGKIVASKKFTGLGYAFFLAGFLLQLISTLLPSKPI